MRAELPSANLVYRLELDRAVRFFGFKSSKRDLSMFDHEKMFAQLGPLIKLEMFAHADFLLDEGERPFPDLLILDVDLPEAQLNGLEVAEQLRRMGFAGMICMHSNRYPGEKSRSAFEAGADDVFPKPMSSSHFLQLILAAIEREPR